MIEITDHGATREIRLARPPVNALNTELVENLTTTIREAAGQCRALVLSGRDGMFSAGVDLPELLPQGREAVTAFWTAYYELLKTVACSPIPIASAITGHSPAGGAVITIMSDYRVMTEGEYLIGMNEARVGLVVPPSLYETMAHLVGPRTAQQMLMKGELVKPGEALKRGLVDALEPDYEKTLQHALQWAEELSSIPRHSMLGNREVTRSAFRGDLSDRAAEDVMALVDCWFSDDTQAVMTATVEKLKGRR